MENSLQESHNWIFSKIIFMFKLVGINSFKDNYNPWEAIFISGDIPIYLFVNYYSVWYFSSDFVKVAIILVPSGYGFQGIIKIYLQTAMRENILLINQIIINFYKYIKEKYPKYINTLHKKQKICILLINIMRRLFVSFGFILGLYPFAIMIYTKHLQLPFGFILPGINYETHPGFEINYLFHLIQIYLVVLGLTGADSLCLLNVYSSCLQIEAIILMLGDLDNLLDCYDSSKEKIENIINDIIETHQIQRRYMQLIDQTYKMNYLIVIATDMLQIGLVLIVSTSTTWYLGLIFLMVGTIQILGVCLLGTYMIIMHEKLEQAVYNIKWYNLTIQKQKHIKLVLMVSQQPINLSIGGIMDLDLNAFVQVYKTIYSFFMMLQNMNQN